MIINHVMPGVVIRRLPFSHDDIFYLDARVLGQHLGVDFISLHKSFIQPCSLFLERIAIDEFPAIHYTRDGVELSSAPGRGSITSCSKFHIVICIGHHYLFVIR